MLKTILVPLDGSACAERAIPVAARLARSSHGSLVFVRVVHAPGQIGFYGAELTTPVEPTAIERYLAEANSYLSSMLTTYQHYLAGIKTETDVEIGDTTSAIFSAARLEHADLIVMCSHRETGLKSWIFKSIAKQTVRSSPVPVLVLHEHGDTLSLTNADRPLRILVPLDGSPLAEAALEPAARLAALLSAPGIGTLHLLSVIDIPSSYGYMRGGAYIDAEIRERARKAAERYLTSIEKRFQEGPLAGIPLIINASVVVSTDVVGTIIRQAEHINSPEALQIADMIAIATHGHGGLQRLLMGSVTEHLLGFTSLPLLVVRPENLETKQEKPNTQLAEAHGSV
jgi:nucleotide-binding universal stress UspA family protein